MPCNSAASPSTATLLMGLYTLAMIITTPILGRLSDFYGRRPVLMLSMLGACAGYLLLANANSLWVIALARLISGAMAGNIATAQAYMTDVSSERDRAKAMGLIGAAFGLGFIIGPVLGSWLAGDNFATANLALPAYVSAGLSFLAFVAVLVALPETLTAAQRAESKAAPRQSRLQELVEVFRRPLTLQVIMCGVIYNVGAGLFETIFPIWASDRGTHLAAGPNGLIPFLLVGGMTLVVVQGTLVGPLSGASASIGWCASVRWCLPSPSSR